MLRFQDSEGWCSFHMCARSGILGFLDLRAVLGFIFDRLPVNITTTRGITMLQLVRMYECMYVCMYVCMCVYVCMSHVTWSLVFCF